MLLNLFYHLFLILLHFFTNLSNFVDLLAYMAILLTFLSSFTSDMHQDSLVCQEFRGPNAQSSAQHIL